MQNNWSSGYKEMKGSHHWEEPCFICNQWIRKGEDFYLLIIPNEIRSKYKINNFIAHKEEWNEFSKDLSDEELAEKIMSHKKPRRKPFSEEELQNVEFFKEACIYCGYNKCVISKDKRFVKMKRRKTSFTLIYDIAYNKISYDTNAREGLFGGLFANEFVARVCNKFYELKGLDIREDFTVAKVLDEAVKDVDKLMGK